MATLEFLIHCTHLIMKMKHFTQHLLLRVKRGHKWLPLRISTTVGKRMEVQVAPWALPQPLKPSTSSSRISTSTSKSLQAIWWSTSASRRENPSATLHTDRSDLKGCSSLGTPQLKSLATPPLRVTVRTKSDLTSKRVKIIIFNIQMKMHPRCTQRCLISSSIMSTCTVTKSPQRCLLSKMDITNQLMLQCTMKNSPIGLTIKTSRRTINSSNKTSLVEPQPLHVPNSNLLTTWAT